MEMLLIIVVVGFKSPLIERKEELPLHGPGKEKNRTKIRPGSTVSRKRVEVDDTFSFV